MGSDVCILGHEHFTVLGHGHVYPNTVSTQIHFLLKKTFSHFGYTESSHESLVPLRRAGLFCMYLVRYNITI